MAKLSQYERREIATELWRMFCLHAKRISFVYERNMLTIRVPFPEEVDLVDDEFMVAGVITDYNSYVEPDLKAL